MLSFETNNLLQAADKQIAVLEYSRAKLEKPWDGERHPDVTCPLCSMRLQKLTHQGVQGTVAW